MSNLERLIIYEITRTSGEDNSQNIDVHVRRQDVDNVDVVPGEQYRKQSDVENYREDEVSERNVEECLDTAREGILSRNHAVSSTERE
jgi:hypothetical protein